jgi:hypothetical protein
MHVQTIAAPDFSVAGAATFRLLPVPRPRDGEVRRGAYDPMVNNSIANRALRTTITSAFIGRGYVANEHAPDFEVAVYAAAHERMNVTAWDYGYPFWPRSRWAWPTHRVVTEYTEGTVIVDVVSARDRELLWRGSASARLSDDPSRDVKALQKVAAGLVEKFPRAVKPSVVTRR